MSYYREQSTRQRLTSQIEYARHHFAVAIFAISGGSLPKALNTLGIQNKFVEQSLRDMCEYHDRPGPIAAREREIAVKAFPPKKVG